MAVTEIRTGRFGLISNEEKSASQGWDAKVFVAKHSIRKIDPDDESGLICISTSAESPDEFDAIINALIEELEEIKKIGRSNYKEK